MTQFFLKPSRIGGSLLASSTFEMAIGSYFLQTQVVLIASSHYRFLDLVTFVLDRIVRYFVIAEISLLKSHYIYVGTYEIENR